MKKGQIISDFKYKRALLWQWLYRTQYVFRVWQNRHAYKILTATFFVYFALAWILEPQAQKLLEAHFFDKNPRALETLQSAFLTLGGSLIGGSAIAFSLVMFAMQVNVERMPHGLFRKFSQDWRLIGSFLLTLILSMGITFMSLISTPSQAGAALTTAIIATVLIFTLFLYAYKRALLLINPIQQLNLIIADAGNVLKTWGKRAERAQALFDKGTPSDKKDILSEFATHDAPRTAYLKINTHWTEDALRAMQNITSFSRRYAEQGDHEVSGAALNALVILNHHYVRVKGKTFFTNPPFFDNPLSTDGFINNTLEHLRQSMRYALSRGDEKQIEQIFETFQRLIFVYLSIDYSTRQETKYHAALALGYLADAIQSVAPHGMPDVLMRGLNLLGSTGEPFLSYEQEGQIATIADKLCMIGATGIAIEKNKPVLLTAVDQLAKLTFSLLRTKKGNIKFSAKSLKNNITLLTEVFLVKPDTPMVSQHSTYLAPYYSGTSLQSFSAWMTELVNSLASEQMDDQDARRIIENVVTWADGIYEHAKKVFLLSIDKKSAFVFDITHWITHIAKVLLALGNMSACDEGNKEELEKHALWLVSVLDRVPDNKDSVTSVENWSFRENLLDAALDAKNRGYNELADKIQGILFSWAFKAGKYQSGWGSFEYTLYDLMAFALLSGTQSQNSLKEKLSLRLTQGNVPDADIVNSAARNIRREANAYKQADFAPRTTDQIMGRVDQTQRRIFLLEIADILSPKTKDDASDPDNSDLS
jgi:hypothetical protein